MRALLGTAAAVAAACAAGLWITRPLTVSAAELPAGDAARGALAFAAAGCASCHMAPGSEDRASLPGGRRLDSPFGTFVVPNISSHPLEGIGSWSDAEVASAVVHGTSPRGAHYYPAFPYPAYGLADLGDVADIIAHLRTLPPSDAPSAAHEIGFPWNVRLGVGVWNLLNLPDGWTGPAAGPEAERGRYVAEALAHCAECHTPRDAVGGLDRSRWMAGAPNPSGAGRIPGITPATLDWSEGDVAYYLSTGLTPDFDSAGGSMAEVIAGLKALPEADLAAIAAYVAGLAPVEPAAAPSD